MLPNENDNRDEILRHFAIHFANCEELISFAREAADAVQVRASSSGLQSPTLAILTSMIVRETRKLRGTAVLCERGFVAEAEQLVRSLFEGALAARFVCQAPVPDNERPSGIKSHEFPPIPAGVNPIDFRSRVYAGHQLVQKHRSSADADVCAIVPAETIASVVAHATQLKSDIGEDWARRIGKTKGYSGLSVKDLAGNYGLLSLYSCYKEHSNRSHANDAFACVTFNADGSVNVLWCGKDEKYVPIALKLGGAYFADTCHTVLQAVGANSLADQAYAFAKAINDCE